MADGNDASGDTVRPRAFVFGPYHLDTASPALYRDDLLVHLPARCLEVLEILVRRPGELVTKEELLEAVWDDVHVTEDALTQTVSRIRQALGDEPRQPSYIRTAPRRGYVFVATVHEISGARGELTSALESLPQGAAAGQLTAHRTNPLGVRGGRQRRSRAFARAAAVATIVLAIATMSIVLPRLVSNESESDTTAIPYKVALAAGRRLQGAQLTISPNGDQLAFSASDEDGDRVLFRKAITDLEPVPIPGTDGAFRPFFSWDGSWLAYFADGKIMKVAVDGGGGPMVVAVLPDDVHSPSAAWGPDDTIIYGSHSTGLRRIRADGGGSEDVLPLERGPFGHGYVNPHYLPGGRAVLFTLLSKAAPSVWALDLSTMQPRLVVEGSGSAWLMDGGELVFGSQAALMSVGFDLEALQPNGEARLVATDVAIEWYTGKALAAVSRDGDLAYVVRNDGALPRRSIVRLRRGDAPQPVTTLEQRGYIQVQVSPSGQTLALATEELDVPAVWIARTDQLSGLRHVGGGGVVVWDHEQDRLLVRSREPDAAHSEVSLDGGEPARFLFEPGPGVPVAWFPDEARVLFQAWQPAGHWRLELVDYRTAELRKESLTERSVGGAVSPDGRYFAYALAGPGSDLHVYVEPFPHGGVPQPVGPGRAPLWSPVGDEIFFVQGDNELVVVSVRTDPEFEVTGKIESVTSGNYRYAQWDLAAYDVTPDGKEIYLIGPNEASGATEIVFIVNGLTR